MLIDDRATPNVFGAVNCTIFESGAFAICCAKKGPGLTVMRFENGNAGVRQPRKGRSIPRRSLFSGGPSDPGKVKSWDLPGFFSPGR